MHVVKSRTDNMRNKTFGMDLGFLKLYKNTMGLNISEMTARITKNATIRESGNEVPPVLNKDIT